MGCPNSSISSKFSQSNFPMFLPKPCGGEIPGVPWSGTISVVCFSACFRSSTVPTGLSPIWTARSFCCRLRPLHPPAQRSSDQRVTMRLQFVCLTFGEYTNLESEQQSVEYHILEEKWLALEADVSGSPYSCVRIVSCATILFGMIVLLAPLRSMKSPKYLAVVAFVPPVSLLGCGLLCCDQMLQYPSTLVRPPPWRAPARIESRPVLEPGCWCFSPICFFNTEQCLFSS